MEFARVELRERAGGHELRVEVPERGSTSKLGFLFSRSPEVLVRVTMPARRRPAGRRRARPTSMRAAVSAAPKSRPRPATSRSPRSTAICACATSAATPHIGHIGRNAEVQTVSGDVTVEAGEGAATLQSVSGDLARSRRRRPGHPEQRVRATNAPEGAGDGPVSAQSVSGDIRIGIRPGVRVWIDAASRSGDVTSELEVRDGQAAEGPVAELRLQSLSGDIAIVRSAAVPG